MHCKSHGGQVEGFTCHKLGSHIPLIEIDKSICTAKTYFDTTKCYKRS